MIKNQFITLNKLVTQVKGNIVSDMDGETVMMSIDKGKYYNLGEIGGAIWDLIKSPITVNLLVNTLASEYSVEQIECENQVLAFLEDLSKEGLISIEE